MSQEGYIKVISSIVANNENPKLWTVQNTEIKGSSQNFTSITKLVEFHPFKMVRGMRGTVQDFPSAGKSTDFKLVADPALLVDQNEVSLITLENYSNFWQELETTTPASVRVYNYAADGPGGGAPVYPYTLVEESNWTPEFDAQKNHRWLRFRDDNVDDNSDGIFDNWTVPISLNSYSTGDYVENRFQRYALSKPGQNLTQQSDLENGRYYVVTAGTLTINGILFETGQRFTFTGQTVVFAVGAIVIETNMPPARIDPITGLPNNEPVGWDDTPSIGTDTLWMITGQKSVYGQLKSEWVLRKIDEQPDYVRYSYSAEPNPNTLCSTAQSAADGTPQDTALIAAGWIKTFTDQTFMAYRSDAGGGTYTTWQIEKISGESGEYIDNVFKLYPVNIDPDSPSVTAPTTRTPENEGWSDSPLVEGPTDMNFISSARKFFDGTLKTPWSAPIPYTGKSAYQDIIVATPGDEFKINPNVIPNEVSPAEITLENRLFKGVDKLWELDVAITYQWFRVYNNGAIDNTEAGPNSGSDFYYLPATGTPATAGYKFANQRIVVKPAGVTGKAVFRCTATLQTAGDSIVFEEEISLLDISDGLDAKNLSVTADAQIFIYDSVALAFVPTTILLRAYYANIGTPTLYWYKYVGAAWTALTTGQTYSSLASNHFAANTTAQEARFAVSNHPTDPNAADGITYFTDTITIGKSSAAGVGSPGQNSVIVLLSNESHTVVVDNTTDQPFAGEIGVSGKAVTKVEVWDGTTKIAIGASAQPAILAFSSSNANIVFAATYGTQGSDAEKYANVYVNTWAAGQIGAVCTMTVTYGGRVFTKQFTIASTQDAPGAILLDIDSDSGYEWTPSQRANKTLSGNLYDSNVLQTSGYEYRWLLNGIASLGGRSSYATGNRQITISRTEVGSSANVTCEVRAVGQTPALRSQTIKMTDVLDNQMWIAWTDTPAASVNNSHKIPDGTIPSNIGPSGINVNGVVWRLLTDIYWATHVPTVASTAEETTTTWVWTYPYRITGEQGDQGPNGDYFFNMFKVNGTTVPASNSSIGTMKAAGWLRLPPTTGIVYMTTGRFNGQTNPPTVAGYPQNSAVPEDGWSPPTKLTGTDGTNGAAGTSGTNGTNGWSPVFALQTDGTREVLKVTDWVGGTGTKPAIGQYVGTTGLVNDITNGVNVRGRGMQSQVGGSTWTQPFAPANGDVWINRVIV